MKYYLKKTGGCKNAAQALLTSFAEFSELTEQKWKCSLELQQIGSWALSDGDVIIIS